MACPPGERALSDGACQPAGVPPEACAADRFEPDGRGGCAPILPAAECPFGQMAVPGQRACREVSPCGEGPWGNIPVDATTEYVDQRYAGSDSDGSRAKPWRTVSEGVLAASPGAIVAVAEGSYREDVLVTGKAVRLWGRCPVRTEVVGTGLRAGGAIAILRERATGSEVRGLAVTGPRTGVFVQGAGSVVLEEVWIHDAEGFGVVAIARAGVTLRGTLLEQNSAIGMMVHGADATVEATVVRKTRPDAAGSLGRGIVVQGDLETGEGGTLRLRASILEENHEAALFVSGSEATVEATVVRATQPNGAGQFGRGINVQPYPETGEGGELWLTASRVEENHDVGVYFKRSEATIAATVVRATKRAPAGLEFGDGILVEDDWRPSDVAISATESTDNDRAGVLYVGSTGELSRVRSSGNRFGLVLQPGTTEAQPVLGEGNVFEGNTGRDELAGGDLPVPDAVSSVP